MTFTGPTPQGGPSGSGPPNYKFGPVWQPPPHLFPLLSPPWEALREITSLVVTETIADVCVKQWMVHL